MVMLYFDTSTKYFKVNDNEVLFLDASTEYFEVYDLERKYE